MKILSLLCILLIVYSIEGSAWTPSSVLEPGHPRIIFTSDDSAAIASRLSDSPFSSYYSSIWSKANSTYANSTQYEDFVRSGIAMSAAYVLYFGVKPGGDTLTTSEIDNLSTKAIDYLSNLITTMDNRFDNSNYHYPCERLIQYSIALDLLMGAGIVAPTDRVRNLANTIYDNATYWLITYVVDDISLIMNHKLIVGGALGTAALILPSDGGDWIDYSMTKIDKVLFTDESDGDSIAGFAEGPHYFKYSMEHMVQFILGMKNYVGDITDYYTDPCGDDESGFIRTPWYDLRWDKLYFWIASIRKPSGTCPPLGDSFRHDGFSLTAPFAERNPFFFWDMPVGVSRMFIYPMLVSVGAEPGPAAPAGLTCFTAAGNLIFRSDTTEGSIYFHMSGEHGIANTRNHDQSDAASYILHAFGEDLAIDAGYISWSECNRVNGVDKHNTVLVNGGGPLPSFPADAYIGSAFDIKSLCFGKVNTSYSSSDIQRSSALFGDKFVAVFDDINRSSGADFTFQCHGNGLQSSGTFSPDGQSGLWTGGDSVSLRVVVDVINSPDAVNYENSTHETGYNSWADHTVLRATKNATETKFISLLFPFTSTTEDVRWSIPGIFDQATIRFGVDGKEGLLLARYGVSGFDFGGDSLMPEISGVGEGLILLIDSLVTDEKVIYVFATDSLRIGGELVFRSSVDTVDLGLSFYGDTIQGYLNGSGERIVIGLDASPYSVTGAIAWSWAAGELELILDDNSEFIIEGAPPSVEEKKIPIDFSLSTYPNPFNSAVTISLDVPVGAGLRPARVEIFDLSGRRVAQLPSPSVPLPAGEGGNSFSLWEKVSEGRMRAEFTWQPDASIGSGVYLVRANINGCERSARVVYLK